MTQPDCDTHPTGLQKISPTRDAYEEISTHGAPFQLQSTNRRTQTCHRNFPSHQPLVHPLKTCLMGLFLLLLSFSPNEQLAAAQQVYFPELFNAALNRPVSVSPELNVCGMNTPKESFCKSSADAGTLTSCWSGSCTLNCPDDLDHLPYFEYVFDRADEGWGDCIYREYNDFAPAPATAAVQIYRVHFTGNGNGTCRLVVTPEWLTTLFLQPVRSVSIAMWIRPSMVGRDR